MKENKYGPKPDLLTEIRTCLEAKTMHHSEIPTIQRVAEELGIPEANLDARVKSDQECKEGLEKLTKIQDENLFSESGFDNRADVMLAALFLLETKNRREKPENQ